jgi:hypothetical protein
MILYFRFEKARIERNRIAEAAKGVGKPKVGGKFDLVNQDGQPYTDEDMKGKFALVRLIAIVIVIPLKANPHLGGLGLLWLYTLP